MPYYKWQGIDWYGNVYTGEQFAKSPADLEKILLQNEIGLIAANKISHISFFRPISLNLKVQFFKKLSVLINSGVLLHVALDIIEKQINHIAFKKIIEEIRFEVHEGSSLSNVMEKYPEVFDSIITQMIKVGEESGKLNEVLISLSEYLERYETFIRKLRSLLLLPAITFGLFLIILFVIFTVIIPSFSTIFHSTNQQIPTLTQYLLDISNFLKDNNLIIFISVILVCIFIYRFFKTKIGKNFSDKLLLKLPFIGRISKYSALTYFLQSNAILLKNGVTLVRSLEISSAGVSNSILKQVFIKLPIQLIQEIR